MILNDRKKFNKYFWFILCSVCTACIDAYISFSRSSGLPSIEVLENPKINLASQVLSMDGKMLGSFYYKNQTAFVDFNELPKHLIDANCNEDIRFYRHSGIDAGAYRVAVKTVLLQQQSSGGGSTITQQLASISWTSQNQNRKGKAEN